MADVVALAAAADEHACARLQTLREDQAQAQQALRFATWVQRQLLRAGGDGGDDDGAEGGEGERDRTGGEGGGGEGGGGEEGVGFGTCPVCLEHCDAVCALPHCFYHTLTLTLTLTLPLPLPLPLPLTRCVLPHCFHHVCHGCLTKLCGEDGTRFHCPLCRTRQPQPQP